MSVTFLFLFLWLVFLLLCHALIVRELLSKDGHVLTWWCWFYFMFLFYFCFCFLIDSE